MRSTTICTADPRRARNCGSTSATRHRSDRAPAASSAAAVQTTKAVGQHCRALRGGGDRLEAGGDFLRAVYGPAQSIYLAADHQQQIVEVGAATPPARRPSAAIRTETSSMSAAASDPRPCPGSAMPFEEDADRCHSQAALETVRPAYPDFGSPIEAAAVIVSDVVGGDAAVMGMHALEAVMTNQVDGSSPMSSANAVFHVGETATLNDEDGGGQRVEERISARPSVWRWLGGLVACSWTPVAPRAARASSGRAPHA